jgi:hypothetical protein
MNTKHSMKRLAISAIFALSILVGGEVQASDSQEWLAFTQEADYRRVLKQSVTEEQKKRIGELKRSLSKERTEYLQPPVTPQHNPAKSSRVAPVISGNAVVCAALLCVFVVLRLRPGSDSTAKDRVFHAPAVALLACFQAHYSRAAQSSAKARRVMIPSERVWVLD